MRPQRGQFYSKKKVSNATYWLMASVDLLADIAHCVMSLVFLDRATIILIDI